MRNEKIKDIPKIQELLNRAHELERLKSTYPYLETVLKNLNVDIDRINDALDNADVKDLAQRAEEIAEIPDRFNDHLGPEGWIIYEGMNLGVAETVVEHAENGDLGKAENHLIEYYDSDVIEQKISLLSDVDAFQPRRDLALDALEDYAAERYHASVPVVLALLDGMVHEAYVNAYGESRGFSASDANLQAWDSIAGHSTGLEYLQDLMLQGRQQTQTEELDKPYRNGIMHGMDLGYDNLLVAAKTWGALFAAAEWVRKAEQGELEESEDEDERGFWEQLIDALESFQETQEMEEAIDEWMPRDITVGEDVPTIGDPEEYEEDTAERALIELLTFWDGENYGRMANLLRTTSGDTEHPGDIRRDFEHLDLQSFELVEIDDVAPSRTDINVRIEVERFGRPAEGEPTVTLIYVGEDGRSRIPSHGDGEWAVTTGVKLQTI